VNGDLNVPKKSFMLGTSKWAVASRCQKIFVRHILMIIKNQVLDKWQWLEGFFVIRLRMDIKWTNVETIVTSKNFISHSLSQFLRDSFQCSSMLNRQIRYASLGIQDVGFYNGARGAGLYT